MWLVKQRLIFMKMKVTKKYEFLDQVPISYERVIFNEYCRIEMISILCIPDTEFDILVKCKYFHFIHDISEF